MLEGLTDKLRGFVSGRSLTKKIGDIKQGQGAPSPFDVSPPDFASAPDMSPFNTSPQPDMPDMAGFGDTGTPDLGGMSPFGAPPEAPFGDDSGMPAFGSPQTASAPVESELARKNAETIDELSSKFAKLDATVSTVQRTTDEMRETVNKLDESVLELLSLYEVVSNQVNPFVGEGEGDSETIERFDKVEKRVNALGESIVMVQNDLEALSQQTATGLSDEAKVRLENIDARFETLAESIELMRSDIGKNHPLELEKTITEKIEELIQDMPVKPVPMKGSPANDLIPIDVAEGISNEITEGLARLDHLDNNPMTAVVLLNWIEFLMERVGRNNLMDALDYYVDIGWIGDRIRDEMLAYARGIDYYVEKPTWRLLPEDHTKSLIFIERLRGHRIDRNMLSTIEREMSKVKHGLEELYSI
ncbi:MAG: FlaD/FlaE family flagellar protein [Euryarchaeota archaeon]|nr:FlaD/FlaE family flagellar protein [Euryarchaeota archaeon]